MNKTLGIIIALAVLTVASCGDDDGVEATAEEQEVVQALRDKSSGGSDSPVEDMNDEEMTCIAKGIVKDDALMDAVLSDIEFEEMTVDQQVEAFGMFVDCAGDTLADVMAQGMAEGSTMSDDQANCLAKGILNDREMMIDFLEVGANDAEPGADLLGSFMGLLGDCDVSLGDLG